MSRLKAALDPRSVAIIGASENPNKVGGRPVHYLRKFGFKGRIFPINPSRKEIQGHTCYPSLKDLPEAPEMVIVAVAGDNAIAAVEDCAAHGVKIAVVDRGGCLFVTKVTSLQSSGAVAVLVLDNAPGLRLRLWCTAPAG